MPAAGAEPVSFVTEPRDPNGGFFIPPGVRATAPTGDPSAPRPGDQPPPVAASAPVPSLENAQARLAPAPQSLTGLPPSFSFPDPVAPRVAAPAPRATAPAPVAAADDAPAPMTVPLPPSRPLGLGIPSQADMPAVGAVPAQGQAPAAAADGPGIGAILGKLGDAGIGDQMMAFGSGLMTKRGIGPGIAAGFDGMQKASKDRAVTDLARGKFGIEQAKATREIAGQNQTAKVISEKLGIPYDQAVGFAGNQAFVNDFLQSNYSTPKGWVKGADGKLAPAPGGENDPATISAKAQAQAEGAAAGKPDETTADQKNYEAAKSDGYEGKFTDFLNFKGNAGRAQTTINNAINPVLKGLGDQFVTSADEARAAAGTVRAVQNARAQLDAPGGIYSGQFADNRLALQKLGTFLGVADPGSIQNTETFRTQIKPIVLETVKGLGAGSGISNADRDFALQAVGGDIKLDEGTIKRVLDITDRANRSKIDRHNALADQMLATQPELKQVGPMMRIEPPGAQPSAETVNAPSTGTATSAKSSDPLEGARRAVSQGADRRAVIQRLLKAGINPKGL